MALRHYFLSTLLATILLICFTSAQISQTTPANNLCQNVTCAANEVCQLVEVQCIRAPCDPQPRCVASTPECSALMDCTLNCSNGRVKDANGCETCQCRVCDPDPCSGRVCLHGRATDRDGCIVCDCNEPCLNVTCPDGFSCEPTKDSTTNKYFGQCVAMVTRPQCAVYNCSNICRFGYKLDNNGCQMRCECYDLCENYRCPANKTCVLTPDCAEGEECRDGPMPYCTDISASTTTSPSVRITPSPSASANTSPSVRTNPPECSALRDCTLNCSNGRVKNANGCETCQCRVCDPDPCVGRMCLYGRATDRDGCIICDCNEPCLGFSCPEGHECRTVRNATTGTYVGQCVLSVTRPSCPNVSCSSSSSRCRYGFRSDGNGCSTCECRDPCQDHRCPENERCEVPANDCEEGTECRDGPMPRCVGSSISTLPPTPQPSTTHARGARGNDSQEALHQCCASAGVSDACLTVCSTNITLLYTNMETLSGCFQYLGDFLRCASGGQSHVNCCNQRGISEACLYLCSGNGTVDISNPHSVTQCVLSSSQTVLSCFSEGLTDANVTVSTTSTPSSTTPEDVCRLAAEPGKCRGNKERWYYSAKDRACAMFVYGGCDGNGNNFLTKDECLARCSRTGNVCPDVQCSSSCQIAIDQYGCHYCRCGNDCLSNGCPSNQECHMVPGSCATNGTNCPLVPECIGKPDVVCEMLANCTLSCPRGWMTDTRGCVICQCKCQPACAGMVCLYGRVKENDGCDTCECNNNPCQTLSCPEQCRVLRNNATGAYYGECYGTSPRPPIPGTRAPKPSLCQDAPDYGMSCQSNSTRWFYSPSANACRPFVFGGCQGNDNNFQSKQICEALCRTSDCPELDCRAVQNCPYGLKTDDDGCSICKCIDPCEGTSCPADTVCVSQKVDCAEDTLCRDPFTILCVDPRSLVSTTSTVETRTTPAQGCSAVNCTIYCIHGSEKDSNGCNTCVCQDPCKNCTANQTCIRMTLDCPTNDPACANSFIGYCVDATATTATTIAPKTTEKHTCSQRPLCQNSCQYGYAKDKNGCHTCNCGDPCERVTCNSTETCVRVPSAECIDDMCWPASTARCERNCTRPTNCNSLNCTYGLAKGVDGCDICQCVDPCQGVTCGANKRCAVRNDYKCVGERCGFQPTGYCAVDCPPIMPNCFISCEFGFAKNDFGCNMCKCNDPCMNITCKDGKTCVPITFPIYSGQPIERMYPTQCVVCEAAMLCRIGCRYGLAKNLTTECAMCRCYEPCQNVTCPSGQVCQAKEQFNGRYQHVAECAEATATGSTSTMPDSIISASPGSSTTATPVVCGPLCDMSCDSGMVRDANGCEICKCNNPCEVVSCRANQKCVVYSLGNNSSTGQCIDCPMPMCLSPCSYGTIPDKSGCSTCDCRPDPCSGVSCQISQKCVVSPLRNGSYTGQCILCPMPMCLSPCFYGMMTDNSSCSTCDCRPDPCSGYRCSDPNEVCETLLFCPDNVCTPSPVCVDRSRPCDGLQKEYKKTFGKNVTKMVQLNCDSRGRFKPIQCSDYDCWCVDENGRPTTNRSSMDLNCYSGNQTKEKLRIDADFNVIKLGDGWRFKQQVSQQLANHLDIDESLVTVRKYIKGSIITDVVIGSNANTDATATQEKLKMAQVIPFQIVYDNQTYDVIVLRDTTTATPTTSTAVPPSTSGGENDNTSNNVNGRSSGEGHLLMIILICVFVPIAIVAIAATIWFACKIIRNEHVIPARRLSQKSGISTEAESLESGSEKSYNTDHFSSISKEKKIRDTTEA